MIESYKGDPRDPVFRENNVVSWDREKLEKEAWIAATLVEKWGMVQAYADGEDSAGLQKMRLATPEEVVDRAFACAELLMEVARRRGHVHVAPSAYPGDEEANNA